MADDMDFEGQLNAWMNGIEKKAKLSLKDKIELTSAGAEAFKKVLEEETPYNAESNHKVHLKDAITYNPGKNADNLPNGATDVGWDKDHAYIARIVNDGQKVMTPKRVAQLHFKDHAVEKARTLVSEAQKKVYQQIMNGSGAIGGNNSGAKGSKNN